MFIIKVIGAPPPYKVSIFSHLWQKTLMGDPWVWNGRTLALQQARWTSFWHGCAIAELHRLSVRACASETWVRVRPSPRALRVYLFSINILFAIKTPCIVTEARCELLSVQVLTARPKHELQYLMPWQYRQQSKISSRLWVKKLNALF